MKKAISLILVLAMVLSSTVFAFAEVGFNSKAFQAIDALQEYYAGTEADKSAAEEAPVVYGADEDALSLPLIGAFPWTDAKEAVLFSKDGELFAPFLVAKPGEKVYVKANRFTLDLQDQLTGAMPETLSSKTTPVEVTLEKLVDLVSLNESGRANTDLENMVSRNLLQGLYFYNDWDDQPSTRYSWDDLSQWLKLNLQTDGTRYSVTADNGLNLNAWTEFSDGPVGYSIGTNGYRASQSGVDGTWFSRIQTNYDPSLTRELTNGIFGFCYNVSYSDDHNGFSRTYCYNSTLYRFGTGIFFNDWTRPYDNEKYTNEAVVTLHDFVLNHRSDASADTGYSAWNVGIDNFLPYAQFQLNDYVTDTDMIKATADASPYGAVLMGEYDYRGEDGVKAYVNGLFKSVNPILKVNVDEYITTEFSNALIRVLESAGEALDKDFTIQLHLESEAKNGEAAVYSFKMPNRMVTADDFGQGYLRDLTFYNNTTETQTVLVKDGEFSEEQELVIKPQEKTTITVSDGQKVYLSADAIPTTLSDAFFGTDDIAVTSGNSIELAGGYSKSGSLEGTLCDGLSVIGSLLQAEANLAVTDATTFNLGGVGVYTGDKLVILNGRYSLAGMLSVRPYVAVGFSTGY